MGPVENGAPSKKPLLAKDATSRGKGGIGQQRPTGRDSYHPTPSYYNYQYPGYPGAYDVWDDKSLRANPSMAPQRSYGLRPSSGLMKFYGPAVGISPPPVSYPKRRQLQNGGSMEHRSNDRIWSGYSRFDSKDKSTRKGDYEGSGELAHQLQNGRSMEHRSNDRTWNGNSRFDSKDKSTRKGDYEGSDELAHQFQNGRFMEHRSNDWTRNGNSRFDSRDKSTRNGDYEGSGELTRGPRVGKRNDSVGSASLSSAVSDLRDKYNMEEFQTEYESAKFYVIKSYSEDDVQNCIKYDVWSSTPYGNKKLDGAFHDAEVKVGESGKCPVFLFFSVNASGQFVGLAEMIGQVDYNKTMDFWLGDKWNGFFPVKWHIIKDIPNAQLRHILLENNENRPVTFTRDTQEIGLKEGLKMLKIFKDYPAKSSILDDFEFYEDREKTLEARKSSKAATHRTNVCTEDLSNYSEFKGKGSVKPNTMSHPASLLVDLAKNLSINSVEQKR